MIQGLLTGGLIGLTVVLIQMLHFTKKRLRELQITNRQLEDAMVKAEVTGYDKANKRWMERIKPLVCDRIFGSELNFSLLNEEEYIQEHEKEVAYMLGKELLAKYVVKTDNTTPSENNRGEKRLSYKVYVLPPQAFQPNKG